LPLNKINDLQKRIYANGGFRLDVAATPTRASSFAETQRELFIELIQEVQEQRFILSFSQHGDLLS